jgi:hypothetical protein
MFKRLPVRTPLLQLVAHYYFLIIIIIIIIIIAADDGIAACHYE